MKKLISLFILILAPIFGRAEPFCGPIYSPDAEYYNLFMQEIINDPQYYPFLRSEGQAFYDAEGGRAKNENIQEWQDYLGISYGQAHFLVFKAKRSTIKALLQGKNPADKNLAFATPAFVKKHKQALLYLAYAKYLAPYMAVKDNSSGQDYWGDSPKHTVAELDYDKVVQVLKQSWNAETDKELKLRYGYQLVRFAHYNLQFQTALDYFEKYVKPLDYKPIMYYYAIDQKGGAERGLGKYMQANYDFFTFFIHTKNRKTAAYVSMNVTKNLDLQQLLKEAKTPKAKNDVYLLLGYNDFNNPLSSFSKIIKNSPNAIQAKVLMARAINQLERNYFPLTYHCPYDKQDCFKNLDSRELPLTIANDAKAFLNQTMDASKKQLQDPAVKDKAFWNLTTAYLYFIQKKYDQSRQYLTKVKSSNKKYENQKNKLELLVAISDRNKITPDFEQIILKKYGKYLKGYRSAENAYDNTNSTADFITDILANRYFLQGDYGKAFLLQNDITALEYNPDLQILSSIVKLHDKPHKNAFEKYILKNVAPEAYDYTTHKKVQTKDFDFDQYVAQMEGSIYLAKGKLKKAKAEFEKVDDDFKLHRYYVDYKEGGPKTKIRKFGPNEYNGYANIPKAVFGTNSIECFECDAIVKTFYLQDFLFIKKVMNKRELTDALIQLKQIAQKGTVLAAKANYLLGNFFFNTTTLGYYRELLTFDLTNANGEKFRNYNGWGNYGSTDYSDKLYFKNYTELANYKDNFQVSLNYLKKGLHISKNKELSAQLLFAAAKCEQGIFYQKGEKEFAKQHKGDEYSREYEQELMKYKVANYRPYFKQLKESYSDTDYYGSLKRNCKYFNYYVIHY